MDATSKTKMTPEEYLSNRIDGQIKWYEHKSARNKRWYFNLQLTVIVCSGLIPVFVGYSDSPGFEKLKYLGGALGALVSITGGILALKKYRENWRIYRASAEALQREKHLYFNRIGQYDLPDEAQVFKLFAANAEQIMSSENAMWTSARTAQTEETEH